MRTHTLHLSRQILLFLLYKEAISLMLLSSDVTIVLSIAYVFIIAEYTGAGALIIFLLVCCWWTMPLVCCSQSRLSQHPLTRWTESAS